MDQSELNDECYTLYTCLVIQEQNVTLQHLGGPQVPKHCYFISKFDHWKMERKAELLLSCLFFSSCSAAANSSVFVMTAGGEVGCCADDSGYLTANELKPEGGEVSRLKHPSVYSSGGAGTVLPAP